MDESEKALVGRLEAEVLVLREVVRVLVALVPATPGTNGAFANARGLMGESALTLTTEGQKALPIAQEQLNPLKVRKVQP
ncbi:hypothetical protein M8R20_46215 [Pseudomonas sp. R2.Fl]|nr:hypothetical protein [Pseudomonas sp. R2.Fl]MCL6714387.1 hypothetical protein [Pseudomonas sp. R2.Fl]